MTTSKTLYASVTGVTNPIRIDVNEGYKSASSYCEVECLSTTLSLGDAVNVDIGYTGDNGRVFTGYVKEISKPRPEGTTILTCFDEYVRAQDYLLVSDDPATPFSRTNIDATDLVEDLLNEAGITSYNGTTSNFIFTNPTFNLVKIADAVTQVANVIAWNIWADETGTVHFADRPFYVTGSDSPDHTFVTGDSGQLLTVENTTSEDDLRNKVVVFGDKQIEATASAVSPYLPTDFYKTAVIASPLITSESQAQDSADFNLDLYNRLTKQATVEVIGDYSIHRNQIATVTETETGISGDWFIYNAAHAWGIDGYTVRLTLRQ